MQAKKDEVHGNLEWGNMNVRVIRWLPGQFDATQDLKGLPDGRCPSPHWGYMVKGRLRLKYKDHDEVINGGEVYYIPPGHIPVVEEEMEMIDITPLEMYRKNIEILSRNKKAP